MRRWLRITLGILAGGSVLLGLALVIAVIQMVRPVQPERLVDQHPPIEERSGRRLDPTRCGLNQQRVGEACEIWRTSFTEHEVTFPSRLPDKGVKALRGTLSVPDSAHGPRPGVVLVHGSGPIERDGAVPGDLVTRYRPPFEVYRAYAELLASQGLVVLRYDKRTSPPYRDEFQLDRFAFADLIDDAKDALDFLAGRPEVDGRALVLLGHSQGGQLAPHIVHGDERVAAAMLVAGSTQTLGELLVEQLQRLSDVRRAQGDRLTPLLLRGTLTHLQRCVQEVWDGTFDPDEVCIGGGTTQQMLADYERLARQTGPLLGELHVPVFAIQGSADINVHPQEIPRMGERLRGRDAEWHYVRGLNHSLTNVLAPTDPVRVDREAVRRIERFLASVPWEPGQQAAAGETGDQGVGEGASG